MKLIKFFMVICGWSACADCGAKFDTWEELRDHYQQNHWKGQ